MRACSHVKLTITALSRKIKRCKSWKFPAVVGDDGVRLADVLSDWDKVYTHLDSLQLSNPLWSMDLVRIWCCVHSSDVKKLSRTITASQLQRHLRSLSFIKLSNSYKRK